MDQYFNIRFIPIKWSANLLDTLHYYADLIDKNCNIGKGEERESSHYIEDTYYKWKFNKCDIDLYWCDEEDAEDWMCVSIDSDENQANTIGHRISKCLEAFAEQIIKN